MKRIRYHCGVTCTPFCVYHWYEPRQKVHAAEYKRSECRLPNFVFELINAIFLLQKVIFNKMTTKLNSNSSKLKKISAFKDEITTIFAEVTSGPWKSTRFVLNSSQEFRYNVLVSFSRTQQTRILIILNVA